jgi:hypothetical protein
MPSSVAIEPPKPDSAAGTPASKPLTLAGRGGSGSGGGLPPPPPRDTTPRVAAPSFDDRDVIIVDKEDLGHLIEFDPGVLLAASVPDGKPVKCTEDGVTLPTFGYLVRISGPFEIDAGSHLAVKTRMGAELYKGATSADIRLGKDGTLIVVLSDSNIMGEDPPRIISPVLIPPALASILKKHLMVELTPPNDGPA